MAPGAAAMIVAAVAVLGGAGMGAYLLLGAAEGSTPSTLMGDSTCPGLRQESDAPFAAPLRSTRIDLRDGETFRIALPAGLGAARVVSEGAEFAVQHHEPADAPTLPDGRPIPRAPPPSTAEGWTQTHHFGWCFSTDHVVVLLARGDGVATVEHFAPEDAGVSVMGAPRG